VPANQQGLLQGAMTSVMTGSAIFAPPLTNGLFAVFISPEAPLVVPGAPFFLGSLLCLASLVLAARGRSDLTPAQATEALPAY
jgi:DHA1 family tetracycline resistance protein-like MFS transporter